MLTVALPTRLFTATLPVPTHRGVLVDQTQHSLRLRIREGAREIQGEHGSVEKTLEVITSAAVETVPGTSHAGVTLVIGRRRFESRAATSALPRQLDELQQSLGEGPCVQAAWLYETVDVDDLEGDQRWPKFAARAVELGVRSMLSFQLYTVDETLGALNLYAKTPRAFPSESYEAGLLLATHAAIALTGALRESQLKSALATRDIIGQAKGMIMERYGIDAVKAFDLLRRLSQETNTPLAQIARSLVEREHPPLSDR
ncbi:GAF and ANTAR domain-containing protein [Skermania sp. ID1734]|uniref:GAF and ANTAR domain-containing protein n=1 Tax=Skermania sp. ID1734 TaxID=2597516 RepID=UPI0011800C2D|nr:GAF and ANTAR domain-containing protein [Skermania sp. ID1734]TSD99287.1 GAF and ANTAR domain-containing protein [Skermania sp. ID1734]